jgi:hypothetical protein
MPPGQVQGFGDALGLAQEGHVGQHEAGEVGEARSSETLDKCAQQIQNIGGDGQAGKP